MLDNECKDGTVYSIIVCICTFTSKEKKTPGVCLSDTSDTDFVLMSLQSEMKGEAERE